MSMLSRREGNSLFVASSPTGNFIVTGGGEPGGSSQQPIIPTPDGPMVEVVVTHDTAVYRDDTSMPVDVKNGGTVQQVVSPGNLDEIPANGIIQVWGNRDGGRIVALGLVYLPSSP
jgi:hypothetical protein